MLTNQQITALAREYTEENNNTCRINADLMVYDAEDVIRFLLRRLYLVEKSKVKEVYKDTKSYKSELESFSRQTDCCSVKLRLLESLFPEIAKEVES